MLEVVVLGASVVIWCQCGQWGRRGVSSHRSKSEVISLSENMATNTDSLTNQNSLVPKINDVMATQWRKTLRNYVICVHGTIK